MRSFLAHFFTSLRLLSYRTWALLSLLALACILFFTAFFWQAYHQAQANGHNALRLSIASDPQHLDPAVAGDSISGLVLRMIGEGLTRLDDQALPKPALAYKWSVSPNGKEYTFYLRHAKWSDGTPLTAHDFVESWQRMLKPITAAPNAYFLFPIQQARIIHAGQTPHENLGVYALDSHTLKVVLEQPTPYFLEILAFDAFFPVPRSMRQKEIGKRDSHEAFPVIGPFKLHSWKFKNELQFEANPHYWDRSHVHLAKIELQVISDAQTALSLFESGALDWIGSPLSPLPAEAMESLVQEGKVEVHAPTSTYWIQCSLKHPLLQHRKARQALSMAIDRKALAQALGAHYQPATALIPPALDPDLSSLLPLGAPLHAPPYLTFDPEKAREYWQSLQAEDLLFNKPLEYIYNTTGQNNFHSKLAQLLQAQWREHLGIEVKLRACEWAVLLDLEKRGEFDLARFGWPAQYSDATCFLDIFEKPEGAYNFSRYSDSRYRYLMEIAHHSQPPSRTLALAQAQACLLDELPVIPLLFGSHAFLKRPELKGVITGPLGRIDFKQAYWEKNNASVPLPTFKKEASLNRP